VLRETRKVVGERLRHHDRLCITNTKAIIDTVTSLPVLSPGESLSSHAVGLSAAVSNPCCPTVSDFDYTQY